MQSFINATLLSFVRQASRVDFYEETSDHFNIAWPLILKLFTIKLSFQSDILKLQRNKCCL